MATQSNTAADQQREKFFTESRFNPTKQAHGLFSFTGTLAVNKFAYDQKRPSHRDADGNVITGPRNFTASPTRSGKTNDAFFSSPTYVSIGDPYKDPSAPHRSESLRAKKARKIHEVPFKAAGIPRNAAHLEYVPQGSAPKLIKKDPDGGVYFGPRNFYTSPAKKGHPNTTPHTTIGQMLEHIPERPGGQKQVRRVQSIHERAFRVAAKGGGLFTDDVKFYNNEGIPQKKLQKQFTPTTYQHERPFLPTTCTKTHRNDGTFGSFPEYQPNPMPKVMRKQPEETTPFKAPGKSWGTPSPSVIAITNNLRAEFPCLRSN